jgi:caffeoyl-CoA O-methyltransferase
MKDSLDAILRREQAEYLDKILPRADRLIAEMEQYSAENRVPIADREVALFLEITSRAMCARRILEIGMAIGYSAVHFARAMEDGGLVVTIEPDDEMIERASGFLSRAGVNERVRIERGRALEVMPRLTESFDLIFIDAVKEEYEKYLDLSVPLLREGGVIIADNVLWKGQVAGELRSPKQKASTEALRRFNEKFMRHPQLRSVIVPIGDGLAYGVKTND